MRNMTGFNTLLYKEVLRFWKVATQTITAPIMTALLYLLIFGHVLEDHVQVYPGVRYTAFLALGNFQCLCAGSDSAWTRRWFWCVYCDGVVCKSEFRVAIMDFVVCAVGRGHAGNDGIDCGCLGREI